MYVYLKSEPGLYTVGFYTPAGEWVPESDHPHADLAAARVSYLNGGSTSEDSSLGSFGRPLYVRSI